MTTSERLTGTLLGGRYRLVEPMPGTGRSWRARDDVDNRTLVARTVLLPDGLADAERDRARHRALHEAAQVTRVDHPGVAPITDVVVEDGTAWVVSVLPPGRSLGDVLRRTGPVASDEAARIGLGVLDALEAAGVPHGDLTPDDVLLGKRGRIRVTGFATTPVGGTGTEGFGAPEGGPSAAADLWALGVVLCLASTGRMPGPDNGPLRSVLDRLLDPNPSRRADAVEVRRLLGPIAGVRAPAPPELHDPEVAAALAAFEAALPTGRIPNPAHPADPIPPPDPIPPSRPPAAATKPAPTTPGAEKREAGIKSAAGAPTPAKPAVETPVPTQPTAGAQEAGTTAATGAAVQPAAGRGAIKPAAGTPASTQPTGAQEAGPKPGAAAREAETKAATRAAAPTKPAAGAPGAVKPAAGVAAPNQAVGARDAQEAEAVRTGESRNGVAPRTEGVIRPPARRRGLAPSRPPAPAPRAITPGSVTSDRTVQAPKPAPQETEPKRGRRIVTTAAVIVAALVALLVPFLLNRGGDEPTASAPTVAPTTTTAATQSAAATQTSSGPSPESPLPPPAGFRLYRDPSGWSIAVPQAWSETRRGSTVTFAGDAGRTLRVSVRPDPPADLYDAALKLSPVVQAATPGYDFLRIALVSYRGWPTADWEYRAGSARDRTHSLIRSTVPNPQQVFDIAWTCSDRTWTADKRFFDAAARTFDPGA